MTARQQLARLLSLALLILLAIAGLRGVVTAPRWTGPLKSDGLVIGLVLEVILGVLLVVTLRRDHVSKNAYMAAPVTDDAGVAVPAALRFVLKWVLGGGMIAVAVAIIASLHYHPAGKPRAPGTLPHGAPSIKPPRPIGVTHGGHFPLAAILYTLLVLALVAAIVLAVWWSSRLRRAGVPVPMPDYLAEDSEGLRDAVESGRAALAELDDARAAIIACYVAMESSLAARGTARGAAGTPDELLARVVSTGIVRGLAAGAAEELTTLFYEARFSSHPLGQEDRDAAQRALDYMAAELAASAQATPPPAAESETPA
ncbi:MAG TPA: DUF4129 domain-containing protein [Trebonia sp.]|jgi:hypothetical protein|nr:DUF4129 domain-containing protein [Trebonia sp.]